MIRWFFIFLCIVSATVGKCQVPFAKDVWINEAGIPLKTNALVLDAHGLMWLGTEAGLYTFNGNDAVKMDSSSVPVTAIVALGNAIFFGTRDGGIYRFERTKPLLVGKANAAISKIVHTPIGLLVGTLGDGIYQIGNNFSQHFTTEKGLPDDYIYDLLYHKGTVVMGTDLGFFRARYSVTNGVTFRKEGTQGDIGLKVWKAPGSHDILWMSFAEAGTFITNLGRLMAYRQQDTTGVIVGIVFKSPEDAWMVTDKGWLLRANQYNGLQPIIKISKKINAILADAAGNLWLGTGQGLTMVTEGYLEHLDIRPPFSVGSITAMAADAAHKIFYAREQGLWEMDLQTRQSTLRWTAPAPINCLFADSANRLWIGTSGKGVFGLNADGRISRITTVATLNDAHILSIAGRSNSLWVASLNGVAELLLAAGGEVMVAKNHGKRDGISSDYVYRIFIDSRSRVWFATDGAGLSMLQDGRYKRWSKQQGFGAEVVYAITEDAQGNIWAATLDHGLYVYDGHSWSQLAKSHGLQDGTVYTVAATSSGQVLAVTSKGVDVWYPQDKEFRHINKRSSLGIDSFSTALGAAAVDTGGNVYLPYEHGFLVFKSQDEAIAIAPKVIIDQVALFFHVLDTPAHYFHYDQNHLSFQFNGINFAHADRLRYRYRLEGYNNYFTETSDDVVTYTQLPPGEYRFCIQASMNSLFHNPATATYSFTIARAFWKRWWFRTSVLLLLGALIYSLVRWRVLALKRVAQLQQDRMMFEYEHLKSQVNPHFLFNSLNTLASMIEEDPAAAVNYTVQLSDLYRDTLTFHEQDLVPLADEWAVLERYIYIQRSRFGNALQLSASVPELVKQQAKIIPLGLQLLVENAIKHNVVSRSSPLIIIIEVEEQAIRVRNTIHLKNSPEKGTGLGLGNIRQRYARVTKRPVTWHIFDNEFVVKLPLL